MPLEAPLRFERITKRFGRVRALDDLSLDLRPGEILGLLGPNGAGKTTAMHLAMGLLRPSAGHGWMLGKPFGDAAVRARVGYAPDAPAFFAENALGAVEFAARLNGVRLERRQIEETLRRVGVTETGAGEWGRDVRKFSRGMQQRLALALALAHDPELLILDEPAAGLDPLGVAEIRELLEQLRREGKTILLSSHQLAEVEALCDRVAFVNGGRLIRVGTLAELVPIQGETEIVLRGWPAHAPLAFSQGAAAVEGDGLTRWRIPAHAQRRAIEAAWAKGAELVSARPAQRSLSELFREWAEAPGRKS